MRQTGSGAGARSSTGGATSRPQKPRLHKGSGAGAGAATTNVVRVVRTMRVSFMVVVGESAWRFEFGFGFSSITKLVGGVPRSLRRGDGTDVASAT